MLVTLTETVTPATLDSVLTNLGSVMTFLMGKVGDVFSVIQSYPIALIPIGISIAFVCVKFTKNILGI
ncbi:MAG: hypothetical protein PUD34_01400 [bacterium]|nr:hypothetical protein [bacterium]